MALDMKRPQEDSQKSTSLAQSSVESRLTVDCHVLQKGSMFADTWAHTHVHEAHCLPSQTDCI
jgi:hypothetical protein